MFLTVGSCAFAQSATTHYSKTETIVITSLYRLDDEWFFNIFDGSNGSKMLLKLGGKNMGYVIESYDERKQVAKISTPTGHSEITMSERNRTPFERSDTHETDENSELKQYTKSSTSRRKILKNIQ